MSGPPESMPNSDAYLLTYEDGAKRTIWGYSIRYAADVGSDDTEHGDPVKIELVPSKRGDWREHM